MTGMNGLNSMTSMNSMNPINSINGASLNPLTLNGLSFSLNPSLNYSFNTLNSLSQFNKTTLLDKTDAESTRSFSTNATTHSVVPVITSMPTNQNQTNVQGAIQVPVQTQQRPGQGQSHRQEQQNGRGKNINTSKNGNRCNGEAEEDDNDERERERERRSQEVDRNAVSSSTSSGNDTDVDNASMGSASMHNNIPSPASSEKSDRLTTSLV